MRLTASAAGSRLFIAQLKVSTVFILVYRDNDLMAAKSMNAVQHVKDRLTDVFKLRG